MALDKTSSETGVEHLTWLDKEPERVKNAITVDVEEWFHVSRFRKHIRPQDWPSFESRVVENVRRVLALFRRYQIKGTFFILGWVAERHPEVVEAIMEDGHEIATHGYGHQLIYEQTPAEFAADLKKSLEILEGIVHHPIRSYRAPSFSINYNSLWAFEVLHRHGIQVDSSFFPVSHDLYGGIQVPTEFFTVPVNGTGTITECPLATATFGQKTFPIAGGGYLRMFPLWIIERGIRDINKKGRGVVIYFHPWELDFYQPRFSAGKVDRFLHYNNIDQTEKKLEALLQKFSFTTLEQVRAATKIKKIWPRW